MSARHCAVERTFAEQLTMDDDQVPRLRPLCDAVHEAVGAISLQLAHCGGFSKNRELRGRGPLGPSRLPLTRAASCRSPGRRVAAHPGGERDRDIEGVVRCVL